MSTLRLQRCWKYLIKILSSHDKNASSDQLKTYLRKKKPKERKSEQQNMRYKEELKSSVADFQVWGQRIYACTLLWGLVKESRLKSGQEAPGSLDL